MLLSGDHEITEYVRFGFGIRLKLYVRDGALIEKDQGYKVTIGHVSVPLPLNFMMGWATIEERPVSPTEFEMSMALVHPLFGQTFAYSGRFALVPNEVGSA